MYGHSRAFLADFRISQVIANAMIKPRGRREGERDTRDARRMPVIAQYAIHVRIAPSFSFLLLLSIPGNRHFVAPVETFGEHGAFPSLFRAEREIFASCPG